MFCTPAGHCVHLVGVGVGGAGVPDEPQGHGPGIVVDASSLPCGAPARPVDLAAQRRRFLVLVEDDVPHGVQVRPQGDEPIDLAAVALSVEGEQHLLDAPVPPEPLVDHGVVRDAAHAGGVRRGLPGAGRVAGGLPLAVEARVHLRVDPAGAHVHRPGPDRAEAPDDLVLLQDLIGACQSREPQDVEHAEDRRVRPLALAQHLVGAGHEHAADRADDDGEYERVARAVTVHAAPACAGCSPGSRSGRSGRRTGS